MLSCYDASRTPIRVLLVFAFLGTWPSFGQTQTPSVSYNRDIRPLLSSRCFACHGPDSESRQAALRLDQPDGDEGSYDSAIDPGNLDSSEIWTRITSDDPDSVMPPPDSHLKPLTEAEQKLIGDWIRSGAEYEKHWAFTPPKRPTVPKDVTRANDPWNQRPIDRFVVQKLKAKGLEPNPQADPRTLIRRVTFDLTGLPPTRDEIQKFLDQYAAKPEAAWENLVDELLTRPQYGEHVARYWLDVVRFADTNGMHKDFYRNNIEYRNWVIRAFNDNLPYDDFLSYQMAGDLYENPTRDQLVASGFHRLHLIIDRGTALPEESHFKNVLDRVTAVGTAFMGLTVQCAQCHDHKFDPISQKEFYSLYAFFNNLDAAPETTFRPANGLQQPFVQWPSEEQASALAAIDQKISKTQASIKEVANEINKLEKERSEKKMALEKSDSKSPVEPGLENKKRSLELDKSLEKRKQRLNTLKNQLRQQKQHRRDIERTVPAAMVMRERKEIRPTYLRVRGQYDAPGEIVTRGTPEFLPPLTTKSDVPSRMDLANWLVAPDHPLTARVGVNRFWQSFFGVGLVKTSEDFGNQGSNPSHPELLDELTVEFVESGWDVKALHKRIVMSKTYRQASNASPKQFQADSENTWLARGPRFRLDAEMIRDQILASSGTLSNKMFGPSVKPPQPDGLWKAVTMMNERFRPDSGDAILRRSVYTFWKRAIPPPQMTILNAPFRDACVARRERTNTATQALLLLNENEYLKAARRLAQRVLDHPKNERVAFAWETVTCHLPDKNESKILQNLLSDLQTKYSDDPELAKAICEGAKVTSESETVDLAAWTMVCSTLYNLDITKTKD